MLIRNTEWAVAFLEDVGQYAYMHRDTIEEYMRPVRMQLSAPVPHQPGEPEQQASFSPMHGQTQRDDSAS